MKLSVVGVPSSAGAHHAGPDRAPAALRAAGFCDRLRETGLDVIDIGDVACSVFAADQHHVTIRNLDAVVAVARAVADAVEMQLRDGRVPVVLGGDCTVTVGVVAGVGRVVPEMRVAYLDGDADLNAPQTTRSGILDATGVAHLLGIADTSLARVGRTFPLLNERDIVLLGYDPADPDSFDKRALSERPCLLHFPYQELRTNLTNTLRLATAALSGPETGVVVHFDVDAVDSRDLPLANFPHYGTGIELDAAGEVLQTLLALPSLRAVVLTEINPTHDPQGLQVARYVDCVTNALQNALVT